MHGLFGMAITAAMVWACGASAGQNALDPAAKGVLGLGGLMIAAALYGGLYWSIFDPGHGFFTANRISAGIALAALLLAPYLDGRRRALREREAWRRDRGL